MPPHPPPHVSGPRVGVAFMLAQLGFAAAEEFARALDDHELTPPLVGILRLLQVQPGLSQQQLAARLGMVPSRLVGLVDDLEGRGWIERSRDPVDRRVNILTVTATGREAITSIASVARTHEKNITAGLDAGERDALLILLTKLVTLRGLTPGVHPGYRRMS